LTASTIASPNFAASAKPPTRPRGFFAAHSASFAASRVPMTTSCPCFKNPLANTCPTTPEPNTPIFMICMLP